ncbi:MAG: TRIC cation channel family protein [Actinobacteria bacterium]|nr:TRIC cation channel family protein [Actinomycetota bacterium]
MLDALVYAGTVTFAVSGALQGVAKRFDLVGVLVLAGVTAVGGGSVRDLVSGTIPPPALLNEPLLWAIFVAGVVVFFSHRWIPEGRALYAFDTVSLAIFAALGAERGLEVGFGFWGTVFAGVVSGVGGGVIRDLLSGDVPGILYRSGDLYASAAAVGAVVVFVTHATDPGLAIVAGVVVTVVMRVGSRLADLQLPVPRT